MTELRLTDAERVAIALELQALRRREDPSYTVWLDGGVLRDRWGWQGKPRRVRWYDAALLTGHIAEPKPIAREKRCATIRRPLYEINRFQRQMRIPARSLAGLLG